LKNNIKKEKKKALTPWSEEDSSSTDKSQVEEVINICLMAKEEDEVSSSLSSHSIYNFTFDELHDVFNDLMNEFEKVSLKNNVLKKKLKSIDEEISSLKKEKGSWDNEKKVLIYIKRKPF